MEERSARDRKYDLETATLIIDRLTRKNPDLNSRSRQELIKKAQESLTYLDCLIKIPGDVIRNNCGNPKLLVPIFLSRAILESKMTLAIRKKTIVIHITFNDKFDLIKEKFISRWTPDVFQQVQVCFCFVNLKLDYCFLRKEGTTDDDWTKCPYIIISSDLDKFVVELWIEVVRLA